MNVQVHYSYAAHFIGGTITQQFSLLQGFRDTTPLILGSNGLLPLALTSAVKRPFAYRCYHPNPPGVGQSCLMSLRQGDKRVMGELNPTNRLFCRQPPEPSGITHLILIYPRVLSCDKQNTTLFPTSLWY